MSEGGISVVIFIFGACAIAAPVDKISQVAVPMFNASRIFIVGPLKVGTWCPKRHHTARMCPDHKPIADLGLAGCNFGKLWTKSEKDKGTSERGQRTNPLLREGAAARSGALRLAQ